MSNVAGKKLVREEANIREMETNSGIKLKVVYGPEDSANMDYKKDSGDPGEYPYVRSFYPPVATTRPSTHGQSDYQPYMGVGTTEDTRARFEFLRSIGIRDVNFALDLPTQMGRDSDDPRAYGEVGRVGLAIDTLRDMEDFFVGIDLGNTSTNMTINATAIILYAMYFAIAEKQGVPFEKLEGTPQNDIIKEMVARGAWVLDLEPAVKLAVDLAEWCIRNSPRMHPINNSGGHYGQSGATIPQCMACAFESQKAYIGQLLERGLTIDDLGRPLNFGSTGSGGAEIRFFESIAASRAARRMWVRIMKEEYGAKKPRSLRAQGVDVGAASNACSTAREPECNTIRGALLGVRSMLIDPGAMYGNRGGGNGNIRYDGAYAIPTETSHRLDHLQPRVTRENAKVRVMDPLAGSYYVEAMSKDIEEKTRYWMEEIRKHGGMIQGIENGFIQQMISKSAYTLQKQFQTGEKTKIGVNKFAVEEEKTREPEFLKYDWTIHERQIARLNKVKTERDTGQVERSLIALREATISSKKDRRINLIPWVMDCVKSYATVSEIFQIFKDEFGEFREPGF